MKKNNTYTVLYEDSHFIALNKASGILTAQDRYNPDLPRLDSILEPDFGKLFAVHRLDKDTSGVILYAKTAQAHKTLSLAFQNREVDKIYHALVYGRPNWQDTVSTLKLLANGDQYHRTIVNRMGKDAETAFRFIGAVGPYSWIEAKPKTGRTHQIRAHLKELKISIVCDPLYSGNQKPVRLSEIKRSWRGDTFEERPLLNRLALHAYKISFAHPETKETMTITAPYPKDLDSTRKQLAKLFKVDPLSEVL